MAEYVFPVPLNRERTQCGIVSVSGYPAQAQTALARANHAAKRLPIDRDKLLSLLPAQSTAIPPLKSSGPRIRPLADMLAFLAQSVPQGDFRDLAPAGVQRDVLSKDRGLSGRPLPHKPFPETLAKANHCSASYLSHMFKAMSGLSLRAYINALRIRDAVVYLENTDMPVSEIAYALGYGDSNYFSTVFQREKGCPPSAYRKRRGEQPQTKRDHACPSARVKGEQVAILRAPGSQRHKADAQELRLHRVRAQALIIFRLFHQRHNALRRDALDAVRARHGLGHIGIRQIGADGCKSYSA